MTGCTLTKPKTWVRWRKNNQACYGEPGMKMESIERTKWMEELVGSRKNHPQYWAQSDAKGMNCAVPVLEFLIMLRETYSW